MRWVFLPKAELRNDVVNDILDLNYEKLFINDAESIAYPPTCKLLSILNKCATDYSSFLLKVEQHVENLQVYTSADV